MSAYNEMDLCEEFLKYYYYFYKERYLIKNWKKVNYFHLLLSTLLFLDIQMNFVSSTARI